LVNWRPDLVVRSQRVVTPRGTRPAAIHVRGGKIVGVLGFDDVPAGCPVDEAGGAVILPGLVDIHVQVSKGLERTTQAAAAGGITTIIALPPARKEDAAVERCWVDVGFWVPLSAASAPSLTDDAVADVLGFVCGGVSEADLRIIMPAVRRLNATLMVSEVSDVSDTSGAVIRVCGEVRTRTHLQPLSSSAALASLFRTRATGTPITAGASPRQLTVVDDMATREDRELLWAALAGGVLHTIASDRSPLELGLAATWAEARARGYSLDQLAQWMAQSPARVACLERKGAIDVGYHADLVVFDPDAEVKAEMTPYLGQRLRGVVARTYLRGTRIWQDRTPFSPPCGKLLSSACGHAEPRT
jgi:allantoinase